jgi:hypothetical protein
MTVEEKVAIQNLVLQHLQGDAERHPTLLLDALLSGDGIALVHSIVAQEETQARQRAQILTRLLGLFQPPPERYTGKPPPPTPPLIVPGEGR